MKNNSHQKAAAIALAFLYMGRTGSHFSYLCHCLNRVSGLAARNLEKAIEKRLWPNYSLDGWLVMQDTELHGENLQLLRTEEFKTQAEWEETLGDEYVIHRETDDDGNVVLVAYDKQGRMLGSFILDRSGKGAGINVESGYAHASDVEGSAAYWAREMGKIRDKKPSSLQRYCGANQDQACVDKWNALMKSWNAEYRAATKQWKAADAREKAAPVKEAHYAPSNYDVFKRAVYKIAGVLDVSWKDVYYRFTLDPEYYSSSYDEEAMLDAEFGLGITDGKPLADQVGAMQQAYGLDDDEVNELLQSEEHWQNEFYKQDGENNV